MIDVHIPANLFYPELPGGSNQYFRYGPFLRERGIQLQVHTVRKPHHNQASEEVRGIRIQRYELDSRLSFLQELETLTGYAIDEIRQAGGPACLHPLGTSAGSPSSICRLWRARTKGIPSCFHFMDVPVRQHGSLPSRLKQRAYLHALLSPYSKLLMCSRIMGRAFQEVVGISSRRIEPVPNGIDLSVFSPPKDTGEKRDLRERLDLPTDTPIVLFVGSVVPRKGVDILIDAWKRVHEVMPEARLVIVGSTRPRPTIRDHSARSENETYLDRVGRQVDALPDPDSVVFAGETDRIGDYYRAADLFAFASHHEGLPSVILESMACGTPCVTAPFVGLPDDGEEYGVAGEHFVKSSHDSQQLAEDIVALLKDEEGRLEMGAKAVEWIRETQEMGMATDRLADIYRQMVS